MDDGDDDDDEDDFFRYGNKRRCCNLQKLQSHLCDRQMTLIMYLTILDLSTSLHFQLSSFICETNRIAHTKHNKESR